MQMWCSRISCKISLAGPRCQYDSNGNMKGISVSSHLHPLCIHAHDLHHCSCGRSRRTIPVAYSATILAEEATENADAESLITVSRTMLRKRQ